MKAFIEPSPWLIVERRAVQPRTTRQPRARPPKRSTVAREAGRLAREVAAALRHHPLRFPRHWL